MVPVPPGLVHPAFVASPLTTANVALDYAAYMASPDVIRVHSDGRWPAGEFTLEQDRDLAAAHQAAHEARRAFTFLLLDPAERECLGCLYLNPLRDYLRQAGAGPETLSCFHAASAMVTFWIRQDHQDTGLAGIVAEGVSTWLAADWPLQACLASSAPGRRWSGSSSGKSACASLVRTAPTCGSNPAKAGPAGSSPVTSRQRRTRSGR
jgi:RimJ/RimL family protein N-acetyltransferase